jgi:hypothetical protein
MIWYKIVSKKGLNRFGNEKKGSIFAAAKTEKQRCFEVR